MGLLDLAFGCYQHCYQIAQLALQVCDWLIRNTIDRLSNYVVLQTVFSTPFKKCMDLLNLPTGVYLSDGHLFLSHCQQNYPVKQEFRPQTNKTIIFWSPGFAKGIRLGEGEVHHFKQVADSKWDTCCALFVFCFIFLQLKVIKKD